MLGLLFGKRKRNALFISDRLWLYDWREGASTEIFSIKGIAQMPGPKYDSVRFLSSF